MFKVDNNYLYISESFHTNISNQLFNYKITFVNQQHELEHKFKGDIVLKNRVETFSFLLYKNISECRPFSPVIKLNCLTIKYSLVRYNLLPKMIT